MKNLILNSIAFLLLCSPIFCQNSSIDNLFNKYSSQEGFVSVNINGDLLKFGFGDEKRENLQIGEVKILSVDNDKLNSKLNFYKEIVPQLKGYKTLMKVNETNNQLVILKKKKNNGISEFLLVSGGSDNALIYLEGNLNNDEIKKISKQFN